MKNIAWAGTLAATFLLAACATKPPEALVEARASVKAAQMDPLVQANAPAELQRATESLNRANSLANSNDAKKVDVASAAYVANQHAKIAMTIAKAKHQESTIGAAQLERERTRADVRTAEAQQAQAQAAQARGQAAQAQAAAATSSEEAARLQQQLADLQAKKTDRGMVVTLGDVLFDSGQANVKPAARTELQKLADFLQQHPDRHLLIEGHTDSVGSSATNEQLSQRRADAVENALVRLGVNGQRVDTIGYGEDFPVSDNDSATNRAMNRRVEVYISDNEAPVRGRR